MAEFRHRNGISLSQVAFLAFVLALGCTYSTVITAQTTTEPKVAVAKPDSNGNRVVHRDGNRNRPQEHAVVRAGAADASTVHLVWPTLAVLLIISGCALAAKRWLPRSARIGGGGAINVVARHFISNKQSMCLVRVGDRLILVGVAPERLSTLATIDDSVEVSRIVATMERSRPGSFSSTFQNLTATAAEVNEQAQDEEWQPVGAPQRWSDVTGRVRGVAQRVRAAAQPTAVPPV